MTLVQLLILAFLAEAVWETSKMVWQQGKISGDRVGALVVGILVSVGTQADLFLLVSIPFTLPFIGVLLTGVLISRGANFVHDIINYINSSR